MPQKLKTLLDFLKLEWCKLCLDEKGKTISDADRTLIKDLLGNIQR
jgi:hypothetical protein